MHFNPVAVAHPNGNFRVEAFKQNIVWAIFVNNSVAVFTFGTGFYFATELVGEQLHSVANAKNRHAGIENPRRGHWRSVFVNAVWATGKDYADNVLIGKNLAIGIMRNDFAVSVGFSNSAGDES